MIRFVGGLLLVFQLGCSNRSDALQNSVDIYVKALRRGDPDMALSFVDPEKRDGMAPAIERLDRDLLVSQIEVKSIVPDEKMEKAVVVFLMEYFDHSSSSVVTTKSSSFWKYNDKAKAWLIDSTTLFPGISN